MAQSLASRKQDTKIIQRIAEIEQMIFEMRSNQVEKVQYGNITIDGTGTQGIITIGSGLTITVDGSGNGKITMSGNATFVIGNITIQGQGTILVNDGTVNRVLIGFQSGGF